MRSVHSRQASVSKPVSATTLGVLHTDAAGMSIGMAIARNGKQVFRPALRLPARLIILVTCLCFTSMVGTAYGADLGNMRRVQNTAAFSTLPELPYYGPGSDPLRCNVYRGFHHRRVDRSSEPVSGIRSWWPGLRRTDTLRFGADNRAAGALFIRSSVPRLGQRDESPDPFGRPDGVTVSPSFTGYERWVAEQLGL